MRALWRLLPVAGWLLLAVGVLLHIWLKDRHLWTALFFYAMPKPCLVALAFVLLIWPRVRTATRIAAAAAALSIGSWWLSSSLTLGPKPGLAAAGDRQELKLLYWNLCRPAGLDEEMIQLVNELQPNVATFVEPGPNAHLLASEYQERLPGYVVTFVPRGILWVSRMPSNLKKRGKLEGMGAFATFEVTAGSSPFHVVTADVLPHPFVSREGQLTEALAQTSGRRDAILVGDFNTPAESVFYRPYRERMTNALETAGTGLRETWPMGLPLLSLDHIWLGDEWSATSAHKIYRLRGSDHAALLVTLRRQDAK